MIVLDASVIIAHFTVGDAHHASAAELLERHVTEGFTVHPITLAEVLVGGARVARLNQLRGDLKKIGIEADVPDADEPLLLAELRNVTGLKMPDCCALSVALRLSLPLATFDARLAGVARAQGLTVLP